VDTRGASPLPLQRNIILALLISAAAASWAVLGREATSADMRMATPTMGMEAPLFLAIWVIMMIAMMFPSAAPMVLTFHQVQAGTRRRGEPFVTTWVFVAAYLLVWTLAGVIAYAAAAGAEFGLRHANLSAAAVGRAGGAILVLAGIYQFSPLKHLCLSKCRTPTAFIVTMWRDGVGGAMKMGIAHGAFCLGCCWFLFVILFPLGIMNLAAMVAVTLVIFAEKTLPLGRGVASIAGVALVLYGAAALAVPQILPPMSTGSGMSMLVIRNAGHDARVIEDGGPDGPRSAVN
jgi:predicted metal-binding membrane protein